MAMKAVQRLFLLISLLSASMAWGAEIHGRSSTQLLWYNDFYNGRMTDLVEYLRLSVTGIDKAGKFSIIGYGRGSQNFDGGEGLNGRLYYLYGDYRDLYDKIDFRIGRQFSNVSAGSAIIDGAQVELKNIGPVGVTLFGGRDVIFGINGEISKADDSALGMSVYLAGFPKTDLELSWFGKWDQGDMAREFLGASVRHYLLGNIKLYGNARYDVTAEVFNELLAGVKYFPISSLVLTGEYFQSYPTFDTTSIYSVFAVDRFQQGAFRGEYTVNDKISVNAGYTHEEYGDGGKAEVFAVGTKLRPIPSVILGLTYDHRNGYGGNLNGFQLDATHDWSKQLQLAGGFTYDVYERTFFADGSKAEFAQKYWLAAKYKLARNMAASLRLEDDVNVTYNSNVQGRFVFDYDF